MKTIISILVLLVSSYSFAGTLGQYTSNSDGFDTHTYFYDDGKEVVLIDTQFTPSLTQNFIEHVQNETTTPITKVIVTHPNPDKFNGLSYLHQLGIKSISSKNVAEDMVVVNQYKRDFWINKMGMFKQDTYPEFQNIQWLFTTNKSTVTLKSGETLTLFELEHSAIASSQIVVRVDSTGDLIVGDLIHHKAHAWLEGPLVNGEPQPMLGSWVEALDELYEMSHDNALVYGGRGDTQTLQTAIETQKSYLKQADRLVSNYVMYSIYENRTQNIDDVVELFKNEFPDYKLPYMIQYSIQPLIDQKNDEFE